MSDTFSGKGKKVKNAHAARMRERNLAIKRATHAGISFDEAARRKRHERLSAARKKGLETLAVLRAMKLKEARQRAYDALPWWQKGWYEVAGKYFRIKSSLHVIGIFRYGAT